LISFSRRPEGVRFLPCLHATYISPNYNPWENFEKIHPPSLNHIGVGTLYGMPVYRAWFDLIGGVFLPFGGDFQCDFPH
jgi:hypothetical protein